jgi:hypothetical protein
MSALSLPLSIGGEAQAPDRVGVLNRIRIEHLAKGVAREIARLDVEASGDGLVFITRRCVGAGLLQQGDHGGRRIFGRDHAAGGKGRRRVASACDIGPAPVNGTPSPSAPMALSTANMPRCGWLARRGWVP